MGNKGSFIILLVIIAILTMAVVMLVGYIYVLGAKPNEKQTMYENNELIRRPSDEELGIKKLFDEKQFFVLKNENIARQSAIRVGISLRYFKRVKGIKNCEKKINDFESEIRELVGTYFQNVTIDQVKNLDFKIRAKDDLKNQINDLLNSSEKIQNDIIYDVVFDDWFYQ
ncbi:MAG TPA: flagellar basal body-associated FliL family protein [Clostridiales bacterium]|nr:flagellar basal body-associated FliL family protein [Clostridiales bacterium]